MEQSELDKTVEEVKMSRVSVVVICLDQASEPQQPKGCLPCTHVIYWDQITAEDDTIRRLDFSPGYTATLYESSEWSGDGLSDDEVPPPPPPPPPPPVVPLPEVPAPVKEATSREDMLKRWHSAVSADSFARAAFDKDFWSEDVLSEINTTLEASGGAAAPRVASTLFQPTLPSGWPDHSIKTKAKNGLEGPWIQMRPPEVSPEEGATTTAHRPFCLLCEEWADVDHLESSSHLEARREVTGGYLGDEEEQRPAYVEQGVLDFSMLHDFDLSCPEQLWPSKMRLLRIDPFVFDRGSGDLLSEKQFGLLVVADPAEEKTSPQFGLSLEWCRDSQQRGFARFLPEAVDWGELRKAPGSPPKPEQQLQDFHEAMLHQMLPVRRPRYREVAERQPTAALLVLVDPQQHGSEMRAAPRFEWALMEQVVHKERGKVLLPMLHLLDSDGESDDLNDEDSSVQQTLTLKK